EGEAEQDRHKAGDQRDDTEVIDADGLAGPAHVREQSGDNHEGDQADWDVDVEDPMPAQLIGKQTTETRPEQERDPEHKAEQTLVLAALGRGEEVTDDC